MSLRTHGHQIKARICCPAFCESPCLLGPACKSFAVFQEQLSSVFQGPISIKHAEAGDRLSFTGSVGLQTTKVGRPAQERFMDAMPLCRIGPHGLMAGFWLLSEFGII